MQGKCRPPSPWPAPALLCLTLLVAPLALWQVGVLTFDRSLHFYNLRAGQAQPQMLVVSDIDDPFVPRPDDLLVNLQESRPVLEALLDSLPDTWASTDCPDSAMGPALQAAFLVMSPIGGKLLLFQSTPPSEGVGRIKQRENPAAYGTEKESMLRVPEDPFFKKFAAECTRVHITVDVFACGRVYMDLASLSALCRYTNGQLYYYPGFDVGRDGAKLHSEVTRNLTREQGWEAVMRIRCSKGLQISAFHGHFFIRSSDLLAVPCVDEDKAYSVEISLEEQMITGPAAYVQCALLYTASCGERRIRVHTVAVPVVTDLMEMFRTCDGAAMSAVLAHLAVEKSLGARLQDARDMVQQRVVGALREFRLLYSAQSRFITNKLIYPEGLRMLPLWSLAISKCGALRGGAKDVAPDERISFGFDLMSSPIERILKMVYPACYALHRPGDGPWGTPGPNGRALLPPTSPLSLERLEGSGAYLLDNGRIFIVWVGRGVAPEFMQQVFGLGNNATPQELAGIHVEPPRDNQWSRRINAVIQELRSTRPTHQLLFVVRQGDPHEGHVLPYFVEDRGPGMPSYMEHLSALHKQVMARPG